MSKAKSTSSGRTFTIVSEMKANGAMTVRETTTGETYAVVEYVDDLVKERIAAQDKGSTVRLELAPIGEAGKVCAATRVLPGGLPDPGL